MFLKTSQTIIQNYFPKMTRVLTPGNMFKEFSVSLVDMENKNSFNFTDEENNRILNLINSKSLDNLAKYSISKSKLSKVEAWRLKHGEFKNINDILQIDSFSVKIAEKFYKSLLSEEPVMKQTRKAVPFVTPLLANDLIQEINSSVSINVGVSSIIWSRLELNNNGPCKLTHWERHDINEKKLHLHDLIERCLYIDYLIPQADCYVFENPQVAQSRVLGNAEQVNINVQRAQLMAIMGYALASRNTSAEHSKPNTFYLKRFLAAKLFQQIIGTERISAENTILGLMRTHYNLADMVCSEDVAESNPESLSIRGNVDFSTELRDMYAEAEGYNRELLGQALLLNLAFVRLVLLKDPTATALVIHNPKSIQKQ